jgi:hypothetical protein
VAPEAAEVAEAHWLGGVDREGADQILDGTLGRQGHGEPTDAQAGQERGHANPEQVEPEGQSEEHDDDSR